MPFIALAFWLISQGATVQCDIVALWHPDIAGSGGFGSRPKNLEVSMTACLPFGRNALKKHLPPSPCGRAVYVSTIPSEKDTRTIDQAVRGAAKPNFCFFSITPQTGRSATVLSGAVWVGLLIGWCLRRISFEPNPFDGNGAAQCCD